MSNLLDTIEDGKTTNKTYRDALQHRYAAYDAEYNKLNEERQKLQSQINELNNIEKYSINIKPSY